MTKNELVNYINECIKEYRLINEANKNKLTTEQIKYVCEKINKEYTDIIEKIFDKATKYIKNKYFINSMDELYNLYPKYYEYGDTIIITLTSFYAGAYCDDTENTQEMINRIDTMHKDLILFAKTLSNLLQPKIKNIRIAYEDEDGNNLAKCIQSAKNEIKHAEDIDEIYYPYIKMYIYFDNFKSMVPTELEMDSIKNKVYLGIYDNFVKFVNHPSSANINNNFNSMHISDICHILGFNSDKFNEVISKNHPTGKKINFNNLDPDYYDDDFLKLGNCILIDEITPDEKIVVYCPIKNKMYYCNFEHGNIAEFPKRFNYHCNEFRSIIEDTYNKSNSKMQAAIKELLKNYDKEKNYGMFDLLI